MDPLKPKPCPTLAFAASRSPEQQDLGSNTFVQYPNFLSTPCLRPYHVENTSSRPITEVKQH